MAKSVSSSSARKKRKRFRHLGLGGPWSGQRDHIDVEEPSHGPPMSTPLDGPVATAAYNKPCLISPVLQVSSSLLNPALQLDSSNSNTKARRCSTQSSVWEHVRTDVQGIQNRLDGVLGTPSASVEEALQRVVLKIEDLQDLNVRLKEKRKKLQFQNAVFRRVCLTVVKRKLIPNTILSKLLQEMKKEKLAEEKSTSDIANGSSGVLEMTFGTSGVRSAPSGDIENQPANPEPTAIVSGTSSIGHSDKTDSSTKNSDKVDLTPTELLSSESGDLSGGMAAARRRKKRQRRRSRAKKLEAMQKSFQPAVNCSPVPAPVSVPASVPVPVPVKTPKYPVKRMKRRRSISPVFCRIRGRNPACTQAVMLHNRQVFAAESDCETPSPAGLRKMVNGRAGNRPMKPIMEAASPAGLREVVNGQVDKRSKKPVAGVKKPVVKTPSPAGLRKVVNGRIGKRPVKPVTGVKKLVVVIPITKKKQKGDFFADADVPISKSRMKKGTVDGKPADGVGKGTTTTTRDFQSKFTVPVSRSRLRIFSSRGGAGKRTVPV